jgi:response regulator RpfG family c-di-GMP phosphodiesterase
MAKLLIVDDDQVMLRLCRARFPKDWELIATNEPEQTLALALEPRPDAIILDLMIPRFSGPQLCESLHTLSYTSRIPIFVVSGCGAAQYKEQSGKLGVKAFFKKPVSFDALQTALTNEIHGRQSEHRSHARIQMRLAIKLKGKEITGENCEEWTETENVSARGFLCVSNVSLWEGATVEVFLHGPSERFAGHARVVRVEVGDKDQKRWGFYLDEVTSEWVIQES